MSELPKHANIVIIGGGAVGVSCLYHLALAGHTDTLLIDRNELTSGSTWHAAGNIPRFSGNWAIMNMQRYSAQLYRALAKEKDYPINYHVTGSIRLGHSRERMEEFHAVSAMARRQGMDFEVIDPKEISARYPFIETHDLQGALFDAFDGDIDPAQLTQAMARIARDKGAKIVRFCPFTNAERKNGKWLLTTEKGQVTADIIVNAAGYYAGDVSKKFGRKIPMAVMSHQYILTEEIDALEEWSKSNDRKLPLLRDVDSSYYLRQEKFGLNLGPYERNCRAHWDTAQDPMPEDFSFQLFPDDIERLSDYLEDAMARVPILASAGIMKVINGPIPYTPDGNPLIGPMPGVPQAFEACIFSFGIAQAGGAGKVISEWITEGRTEWDMWSCDPRRFTAYADPDYSRQKAMEVYGHEYAIHFPWYEWPAGRDKKLSPAHGQILKAGGQMGAYNGWERANWFAAKDQPLPNPEYGQSFARQEPFLSQIASECHAVRDHCGVLDLTGFSRFNIGGSGGAEWLAGLITGKLPAIGRVALGYFANIKGNIITEMSIVRHSADHMTLITAAAAQWHDFELLCRALPVDGQITLTDETDNYGTLLITGPATRSILEKITEADLSLPWFSHQNANIAGLPCLLARVSFAGELGWEIHTANVNIAPLYEQLIKAGARPFGMWALDSLRLEKRYLAWKRELSSEYSLLQAGLGRFVDFAKPHGFPGKAAIESEYQQGSKKQLVSLIVDAPDNYDTPGMTNILYQNEIVGEVTSGAYGHRLNASLALGMISADIANAGNEVNIEIFGDKYPAIIQPAGPLWDPKNERMRA